MKVCMYILYVCMYVCMYVYGYVYAYIYVYTCIYVGTGETRGELASHNSDALEGVDLCSVGRRSSTKVQTLTLTATGETRGELATDNSDALRRRKELLSRSSVYLLY
jgi:hypothetical protein